MPIVGGDTCDWLTRTGSKRHYVETRVQQRPQNTALRQAFGHAAGQPARLERERLIAHATLQLPFQTDGQRGDARLELRDHARDIERHLAATQQPHHTALGHCSQFEEEIKLHFDLHVAGKRVDLIPQRSDIEDVAGCYPRTRDLDHAEARLLADAMIEADTCVVDHLITQLRRDQFSTQTVTENLFSILALQSLRKVPQQIGHQVRVVGKVALYDLNCVRRLGIGEQHCELRCSQTGSSRLALRDLTIGWQELQRTVQPAFALE